MLDVVSAKNKRQLCPILSFFDQRAEWTGQIDGKNRVIFKQR
jgi:hypothetical protein